MRVLLVNALSPAYGSTFRCRLFFRMIRELGHEVTYCEANSDLADNGVISVRQPQGVIGFLRGTMARAWLVLRSRCDVCIIQKASPLTLLCFLAARLRGARVILDWDDLDSGLQSTRTRKALTLWTEKVIPGLCHRITTHNHYLQKYIRSRCRVPVVFLPQVIDTAVFDPAKAVPDRATMEMKARGVPIAAFMCTFTEGGARDAGFVFKAFAAAAKRLPGAHLLLIGGGPLLGKLEKELKELGITDYSVTGMVSQKRAAEYLACADVCLVYMRDDNANLMRMSLKTLEYLSMEKPVAGVLVGETRDAVGRFCLLAPDDPEQFAGTIVDALKGAQKPAGARQAVLDAYSPQAVKKVMKELLDEDTAH